MADIQGSSSKGKQNRSKAQRNNLICERVWVVIKHLTFNSLFLQWIAGRWVLCWTDSRHISKYKKKNHKIVHFRLSLIGLVVREKQKIFPKLFQQIYWGTILRRLTLKRLFKHISWIIYVVIPLLLRNFVYLEKEIKEEEGKLRKFILCIHWACS